MVDQTRDFIVANNGTKEKLVGLLTTIFQFDAEDLDFGIYRILNYKKKEIAEFINRELIEEINKQLEILGSEELKKQQAELEKIGKQLVELGVDDYQNNQKYQEKKRQLENVAVSMELEKEIYNHIYTFFSRYYDRGDFISKRRYGIKEKYAIPYNGEETLLHWANNDQYYVKTTESFRKFSFRIPGVKVNFRVVDVDEDNGNVKAEEDKYFLVSSEKVYDWSENELSIYFEFRALSDEEKKKYPRRNQDQINEDNLRRIQKSVEKESKAKGLFKEDAKGTTSLGCNLFKYTRKNTSDYFIHKDLKSFLDKELDFYIKNEVVDLSDVTQLDVEHFNKYVLEVKILRNICAKIIDFLTQIENFQKKLWEKKKFVLATDYCITLDYIDEEYYQEILKNKEQLKEWNKLYSFDIKEEIKKSKATMKGYGEGDETIQVLKQNPTLMIDTKFFDEDVKLKLLESIQISDDKINGILINSENFQALNLLLEKYRNKIKCCYVDPPFNTGLSEILYKNNFKHSSWLSLMENRLSVGKEFLANNGVFVVAIDENEQEKLGFLLSKLFPNHEKTCVTVVHNPSGQQGDNFSYTHEYAYFIYPPGGRFIGLQDRGEDVDIRNFRDVTGESSRREAAANCFYPIYVKDGKVVGFGDVCDDSFHPKSINVLRKDGIVEVYPIDPQNVERKWRYARQTVDGIKEELEAAYLDKRGVWDIRRTKSIFNFKTVWTDSRYFANNYGTQILNNIMGEKNTFPYPKSIYTIYDCLKASLNGKKDATILDFFAGSSTTGHAVLKMNKDVKGNLKYILVEMAQYFDSVTKPRLQKIIYSDNWKLGRPQDNNGTRKHIIKYHYLEQYEDALENVEFSQKKLSKFSDYFIKYMLDFETRDSKTLLNIDKMKDPFNYRINIIDDYQQKEVTVDLVETYNYLIGLEVEKLRTFRNKDDGNRKYVSIQGKRNDKTAIVIWRNIEGLDVEKDRDFVKKNILKGQYDEVHVNADNLIKDAVLIEEQFKTLMNGSLS